MPISAAAPQPRAPEGHRRGTDAPAGKGAVLVDRGDGRGRGGQALGPSPAHLDAARGRGHVGGSGLGKHLAAAATTCGLPWRPIPASRGVRLAGRSHMNLTRLVVHGLSAMAVHVETVGARLLLASAFAVALTLASLVGIVTAVRMGTGMVLPAWTAMVAGLLLVVLMQVLTLSVAFALLSLAWRQNYGFCPYAMARSTCEASIACSHGDPLPSGSLTRDGLRRLGAGGLSARSELEGVLLRSHRTAGRPAGSPGARLGPGRGDRRDTDVRRAAVVLRCAGGHLKGAVPGRGLR